MWFPALLFSDSFYGWGSQSRGSKESHRQVMSSTQGYAGGKKMVFTSSGLVTHIPCFNHSTTHFHTWMLTRLECGSRIKKQQWLVCKRFSSFLSCFQGRGHCICPSPRMGRALEHSNKSNKHLLGTTASALRYWWLAGSSKLCHKGP